MVCPTPSMREGSAILNTTSVNAYKGNAQLMDYAATKGAAQPDEMAPCYVFLASSDSSFMSGQTLHPNGGRLSEVRRGKGSVRGKNSFEPWEPNTRRQRGELSPLENLGQSSTTQCWIRVTSVRKKGHLGG